MYEEAKFTLKQAPRIAVPAARTRPEPSQASQNEATRTLGKALSARCWGDAASRACIDCACCPRLHAHGFAPMPHAFAPCTVREGCPV